MRLVPACSGAFSASTAAEPRARVSRSLASKRRSPCCTGGRNFSCQRKAWANRSGAVGSGKRRCSEFKADDGIGVLAGGGVEGGLEQLVLLREPGIQVLLQADADGGRSEEHTSELQSPC